MNLLKKTGLEWPVSSKKYFMILKEFRERIVRVEIAKEETSLKVSIV